jgi:hypothetical protein
MWSSPKLSRLVFLTSSAMLDRPAEDWPFSSMDWEGLVRETVEGKEEKNEKGKDDERKI